MIDHNNKGAQTEYNGRVCSATVEVSLRIKGEATEDQVAEWLEYEIGGGTISMANPLVRGEVDASFRDVEVYFIRLKDMWAYTDWEAQRPDGGRSGRGRIEHEPPALRTTLEKDHG